jgi:hypothetical protein
VISTINNYALKVSPAAEIIKRKTAWFLGGKSLRLLSMVRAPQKDN